MLLTLSAFLPLRVSLAAGAAQPAGTAATIGRKMARFGIFNFLTEAFRRKMARFMARMEKSNY